MTFDRDAIRGEVNIALRALGALAEDPVEGLKLTEMSAAEVEALFGPAYKSLAGIASKYQVDGEIVHIGWRAPGASSLVVMHDVGKK